MAEKNKKEVLQVAILTLFMVSAVLLVFNFVFDGKRSAAFKKAVAAGAYYNTLKKTLAEKKFKRSLAEEKFFQKTKKGDKDLSSEINNRQSAMFKDIHRTYPPFKKKRGTFIRNSKKFEVPLKQGRSLDYLLTFLGQIESDRPDIHVEKAVFTTNSFDPLSEIKRKWSCSASFVLWENQQDKKNK